MDEKNTEQAYLASVDNNGIFENRASDAYPQTIVADLIRAHLQSGGEKRKKVLLFGFDGARADSMIYLIPSTDPDLTGHNLRSRYSAIADLKEQGGLYLTYAGQAIRNAMMDLISAAFATFEQRLQSKEDGFPMERINLDDLLPGEDSMQRSELIAEPYAAEPEKILIEEENRRELYEGLRRIPARDRAYLLY